jgi:hypothetical protein
LSETWEVKDGGASEFYDPQVLIRDATAVRMEPLSQHFFKPSPEFPGKLRWLPATAQPDPEGKVQGSEARSRKKDRRLEGFTTTKKHHALKTPSL